MSQTNDVAQTWLNNVAYSHSKSKMTASIYRAHLRKFCEYAGTTPEGITKEYETAEDKTFKMKYAQLLQNYIGSLMEKYAQHTIISRATAVRSFFKYRNLPLGFVPDGRSKVTFHNRAILKDEIKTLMAASRAREKAFYTFMVQSGLRPDTVNQLRIKDLEPEFSKGTVPCRVMVPEKNTKGEYSGYFTFIGEDALHYLREYLKTRGEVNGDSYLFISKKGAPIDRTLISHLFQDTMKRLRTRGAVKYETKKEGKPSELRLYTLRKYFRQQAALAGSDYVNYWMGYTLGGVDNHYFPGKGADITEDVVEGHRKVYAEKALPNLRLETPTATETDKVIKEQEQKIQDLKGKMAALAYLLIETAPPEKKQELKEKTFKYLGIEEKEVKD